MKKIVYFDMDDTLCNFTESYYIAHLNHPEVEYPQSMYGFFSNLEPKDKDMKVILEVLNNHYDVWIATRPSVHNPMCYTEKRVWVEKHLGFDWCNKLILIPDKGLLIGDYLVDDKPWPNFKGEQLLFGSEEYPDLLSVHNYFCKLANGEK